MLYDAFKFLGVLVGRAIVLTSLAGGACLGATPSLPTPLTEPSQATRATAQVPLREFRETKDPARAVVRVNGSQRAAQTIPAYLTGKFAEHLGANIYNGMSAQVLRNPTLADFPIGSGQMSPDGIAKFYWEDDRINQELRRQAVRVGWLESALDDLIAARADGLACWWTREGIRNAVQVSPDTGPHGGRAQRVEVNGAGQGMAQWVRLPLHRERRYEIEVLARSPDISSLTVSLWAVGEEKPVASATLDGVSGEWRTFQGVLAVGPDKPADAVYRFTLTAPAPGQFVVQRILLRPSDHVQGADPDVVRLLKESRLPILRWPGGNFVSTYHWEDGVGPIERRPTQPNLAWGGVEPNLFGTDEFVAFCRAVGCKPMICLNAGSGTPAEAARWIEYCNGPANSPMGSRRAANGHPEAYRIKHWEVGNELWGRWQSHWTTAAGYADRFTAFSKAMLAADPSVTLYACGAPVLWGKAWNDTLIARDAKIFSATTDHPLIGGNVPSTTDPMDVYRDFMLVPEVLEKKWASLERDMSSAGIRNPRLAVTELQMFAHLARSSDSNAATRLTPRNLVSPGTLAEALYDVLIYHAAVRLGPFVEMVTHSATVNHGGGLRKEHERVYANPCYYSQAAFAAFAGATPVALEIESGVERAPLVLPDLKNAAGNTDFSAIDALAALASDGSLLVSLVHRGTRGPVRLTIAIEGFNPGGSGQLRTLSAAVPWASNSYETPEVVKPIDSVVPVQNRRLELEVPPFSVLRLRIPL